MKRLKSTAEPIPRKFKEGDRVKPSPIGIQLGWKKHGTVIRCGDYAVSVSVDGDGPDIVAGYAMDFWEAE